MKKVTCVICAYNEGPRIAKVLSVVTQHPLIDEVIVVDDHSHDTTIEEVRKFNDVHIIKHKKNKGKAGSMLDGCSHARNEVVLFIDADLVGLIQENLTRLITPVLDGCVEMTMTICAYTGILGVVLGFIGHECLSGERVLKRTVAQKILDHASGYNAEIEMNKYFLRHDLKFFVVPWPNVRPIRKKDKVGLGKVLFDTCKGFDKFASLLSPRFFQQVFLMGKRSAKYQKELMNSCNSKCQSLISH
jgi:glycosyltransferase involved in cell wall biosynthesis